MSIIKKILERIQAVVYIPIHVSRLSKRSDDLLRIESKLDLVTKQLDNLNLESFTEKLSGLNQNQAFTNKIDGQVGEEIKSNFSLLTTSIEQRFENQFLQFESLLSIYKSLPNLKHLPATRGWAGSPDFLAKLIELIIKEKPHTVLEASSGVSTVVIGLALKLNNYGKVISLDHEELYAKSTIGNVKSNEISDVANIIHCPLRNYNIFDQNWIWYETESLNLSEEIDLLVIDGPPGSTQHLARYPAIPLLHQYFSDRTLIVLDDANRNDEVIIIQKWVEFLKNKAFKVSVIKFNNFEKGLVVLEVCRLAESEHCTVPDPEI